MGGGAFNNTHSKGSRVLETFVACTGGAISGARSFIASWFSDITQESPEEENEANNCEVPIEEELQRT